MFLHINCDIYFLDVCLLLVLYHSSPIARVFTILPSRLVPKLAHLTNFSLAIIDVLHYFLMV